MGASKSYNNTKRYLPGLFDCKCPVTADWFTCQKNEPKPIGMKFLWKNGEKRLFYCTRSLLITKDSFFHQVIQIFIVSGWLMHSLASQLHNHLLTLEPKPQSLLSRNGYTPQECLSLVYTTEALPSSKLTSTIGLRNWESPYDPKQHICLAIMVKLKQRINASSVFVETSWATLETIGPPWYHNLISHTIQVWIILPEGHSKE